MTSQRAPQAAAFLVWVLVGLSLAYWGLRLAEPHGLPAVAGAGPEPFRPVDSAALATALGAAAAVSSDRSRPVAAPAVELLGLAMHGRQAVALLSVGGQPPTLVRAGEPVGEGLLLRAVHPRAVELADRVTGALVMRLELPAQAPQTLPPGLQWHAGARP